jgi:hypothetical protein
MNFENPEKTASFYNDHEGRTNFPKMQELSQNSTHDNGDKKHQLN